MARYRIVRWKDIPSLVEAEGDGRTVRVALTPRFQDLIDALAMREGASETENYLDGWGQDAPRFVGPPAGGMPSPDSPSR